jgi:hypothetical protein
MYNNLDTNIFDVGNFEKMQKQCVDKNRIKSENQEVG